jgi:hypothetical protein
MLGEEGRGIRTIIDMGTPHGSILPSARRD